MQVPKAHWILGLVKLNRQSGRRLRILKTVIAALTSWQITELFLIFEEITIGLSLKCAIKIV